ncbi:hypothetical protein [Pseudalkalibacillus decolorationis]|uniref:hypothetical protein n=1 Tax=Pseudalkalibacillus decolorationis TaxID=163879 RepID=UPI00214758F3|nr:hypothetical protein [Pseudalkalibacillus decolorationis]
MKLAKVAVYFDQGEAVKRWTRKENAFGIYIRQVLDYTGIPYAWIEDIEEISDFDILVIALDPTEQHVNDKLIEFVNQGGTLISYCGLEKMASKFGYQTKTIRPGYAEQIVGFEDIPIRFLKAVTWKPLLKSEKLVEEMGTLRDSFPHGKKAGVAFQKFILGNGEVHRWSIDIIGAIVGFQQGTKPVIEDGNPALDGSANLDDNLLKADDGFELDWEYDRAITETGEKYFKYPYADLWKEILISHLIKASIDKGKTLPLIDYWPEGVNQVAMISHDSDINLDDSAEITLRVLKECNIKSTWCMMEPGYSNKIYEEIEKDAHEIAFHFNAMESDNGIWSKDEFSRQLDWLKKTTGKSVIYSNKNHYTRFEGWGELFEWCEQYGIQSDQTRGPSKKGNIGFLFGTCHPYFPISWADQRNRLYNVVEISFLTQDVDLDRLADTSIVKPFLEQVKMVRGVAHFLFHQIHIYRQWSVHNAVKLVTKEGKKMGYDFWTGKQINDWFRERLQMKIKSINSDGSLQVFNEVENSVVLIPLTNEELGDETEMVKRFGIWCKKQVIKSMKVN